jgi:hypothetical protein
MIEKRKVEIQKNVHSPRQSRSKIRAKRSNKRQISSWINFPAPTGKNEAQIDFSLVLIGRVFFAHCLNINIIDEKNCGDRSAVQSPKTKKGKAGKAGIKCQCNSQLTFR